MTLEDLRKTIREEVRKAVRLELKDLILEAIEIASRPETNISSGSGKRVVGEKKEVKREIQPAQDTPGTSNPIFDVLSETAANMTSEDYENIYGTSTKNSLVESYTDLGNDSTVLEESTAGDSTTVGVDLDGLPSFVKNAKAILDASVAKDRERHAV